MAREPDIILLGQGVGDTLQLTIESQRVLSRVGKVYALYLPPNLEKLLKSMRVEYVDLGARFTQGRPLSEVYLDVIESVLESTTKERPVVLLTPGNPLFLNVISRVLVMQAKERGLSVRVYPGVSQLDSLINYLGLDVGSFGLQVFDARRLVARKHRINPSVPLLVLQLAGVAADEAGTLAQRDPADYAPLAKHLTRFYPTGQPVTVLHVNDGEGRAAHSTSPLSGFADLVPSIRIASHLFIDAVRQSPSAQPAKEGV